MAGSQGKIYKGGDSKKLDLSKGINNKKNSNINWKLLREEWITTNISLTALAEKYVDQGLTIAKVQRHYTRDNWAKALAEYNGMVQEQIEETRRAKATYLASRVIELDERVMTASEKVVDIINHEINKIHPDNRKKEASEAEIATLREMSAALKKASDALKNSHYNIRLACDKATSIIDDRTQQKVKLDEEDIDRIGREMNFIKDHNGKSKPTNSRS